MPNLFRRRQRDPLPTGGFNNSTRCRRPIDPPTAAAPTGPCDPDTNNELPSTRQVEPEIQLTTQQLELFNSRQITSSKSSSHYMSHPKDPSEIGAPHVVLPSTSEILDTLNPSLQKGQLVSDDDFLSESIHPKKSSENKPTNSARCVSDSEVIAKDEQLQPAPFTNRSNKEDSKTLSIGTSKNTSLASRRLHKSSRRHVPAARSSVFRQRQEADNTTMANKNCAPVTNRPIRLAGSGISSGISAHDKMELRKLMLGATVTTELSESAPMAAAAALPRPSSKSVTVMPATSDNCDDKCSAVVTESSAVAKEFQSSKQIVASHGDGLFDQREYVRNLIQQKTGPRQRHSTSTTTVVSGTCKLSTTTNIERGPIPDNLDNKKQSIKGTSDVVCTIKTKAELSSVSPTSSIDPMLQRVLQKSMLRTNSKNEAKKKNALKPQNSETKQERKSLKFVSSSHKELSPKRSKHGLKDYVRKKMGFSSKSVRDPSSTCPSLAAHDVPASYSTDSGEPLVSQIKNMPTDASDGDHTKTTLSSPSNASDDGTKSTYDSSLKPLTTAETLDTDMSSTVMGNLQSTCSLRTASCDSMQYSSEEGCDGAKSKQKLAVFKGMTKLEGLEETNSPRTFSYPKPLGTGAGTGIRGSALRMEYPSCNPGYNTFIKALQLEASETHTQLLSSFQSTITGDPRRLPRRKENNNQYKFDAPTKERLGIMNLYLKRQAFVECVTEAHLVNDKQFSKEVEVELSQRKLSTGLGPGVISKPLRAISEEEEDLQSADKVARVSLEPESQENTPDKMTTMQATRSTSQASTNPTTTFMNPDSAPKTPQFIRQKNRLTRVSLHSKAIPGTGDAAFELSKPTSRHSLDSSIGSNSNAAELSLLLSGVQLRSISSADEADAEAKESPRTARTNTMPSPWKKIRLRRVPDEDKAPMERTQNEQYRMQAYDHLITAQMGEQDRQTLSLLPIPEEKSTTKRAITPDPISGGATSCDKFKTPGIPDIGKPTNFLDELIQKPKGASLETSSTGASAETRHSQKGLVILDVKKKQDGLIEKVAVGKTRVELLHSKSIRSSLIVSWSLPRDQIKALKLDLESHCVNLSLMDDVDGKVLAFNSSPDCLMFANAFYEMNKPIDWHRIEEVPSEDSTDRKRRLEQLNEEEHQVLESYRQARLTQAPGEAMRSIVSAPSANQSPHEPPCISILSAGKRNSASVETSKSISTDSHTSNSASNLSQEEIKIATSYEKMLKLRIPIDAVRHKMSKDEVDDKIVDYVVERANARNESLAEDATLSSQSVNETVTVSPSSNLNDADEVIAAPYRKMLKMMIPKEGVRHKMKRDQVAAKIVSAVIGVDESSPETKQETKLTAAEEATAATYRKMLKLQMPRDAILHKMEKDQVSSKIIEFVLGIKKGSTTTAPDNQPQGGKQASRLVSLHWTPLSGKELDNSVWCATKKSNLAQPEGSDISKLVELFQKKNATKSVKGKDSESEKGSGKAKLIDLNRANIVAISLKAFKDFTYDELASILEHVDPYHKLHGERVEFVKDLLPTPTEVSAVKRYFGNPDRLVPAELWFQKIVHIKRLEAKAHVLHTMEVFESEVVEIQNRLHLLTRVCNQVMESERLRELLDMVLEIGNIMNEGTRTGGASGFKFDSLLRLTQTKSGDGKTTVLDYMVTIYFAKGQESTLDLLEDFPDCQTASRMLISDLVANVKDVSDKVTKCKQEYQALLSDKTGVAALKKTTPRKALDDGDSRAQLLSAIANKAMVADTSAKNEPQEHNPVKYKGVKGTDMIQSEEMRPECRQKGITKLRAFLENAEKSYAKLRSDCDLAVSACREMSQYCGESGGERATDSLLGVLSEFAANLKSAVRKHQAALEAETKKRNQQDAASAPKTQSKSKISPFVTSVSSKSTKSSFPKPKSTSSNNTVKQQPPEEQVKLQSSPESSKSSVAKGSSLVLMVNELLKESSEVEKQDFLQGIVYENPDDRLKAIYEREKRLGRNGMPPLPGRSIDGDLMATIRKRQGKVDAVVAKAKRSQLERVIDCINCATGVRDTTESDTVVSSSSAPNFSIDKFDKFAELQNKWKDQKSRGGSLRSVSSDAWSEGEGSACNPIDCSALLEDAEAIKDDAVR